MTQLVHIHLKDEACAATLVQAVEMSGMTVDVAARLVITDEASKVSDTKQTLWLGNTPPSGVTAYLGLPVILADVIERATQLAGQSDAKLRSGDVVLDMQKRQLSKGSVSEELTDKEAQLMALLMAGDGKVVSKEKLLYEIWGYNIDLDTHTLETHIYRLRGKCTAIGSNVSIDSVDGGYCLL